MPIQSENRAAHFLAAAQAELAARSGEAHSMNIGMQPSDVHIDQALSGFAVGYQNEELLADRVCPIVYVSKESDKYWVHDVNRNFNVANLAIASQRGRPGEVQTTLSTESYKTEDFGLMGYVPQSLIDNADSPLDPQMIEVNTIMSYLALGRELRVASLYFGVSSYGANTTALAGADKWTNTASDPADKIMLALDGCIARPNVGIFGVKAFRALQQNAKMRAYIEGRESTSSGPTPLRPSAKVIAEALELDQIFIARARYNTANPGQNASLSRVWTEDSAAFVRVEAKPSPQNTNAFAYTFRLRDAETPPLAVQSWFDRVPGRKGGTWLKVTHADTEKLISGSLGGYLFTAAI